MLTGNEVEDKINANKLLEKLNEAKEKWIQVNLMERISLINHLINHTVREAKSWVHLCLAQKGIEPANPTAGEEWMGGPASFLRLLRSLQQSFFELKTHQKIILPAKPRQQKNGQIVVKVFPKNRLDSLLFKDITGEVRLEPSQTMADIIRSQAKVYKNISQKGQISLILGAGNMSGLSFGDIVQKLFIENKVVLFKPSPLLKTLLPIFESVFQEFIENNFLHIIEGGAALGSELCKDPRISDVHLTGSYKTFQTIIASTPSLGLTREALVESKTISSELGNITPAIIVPGVWKDQELGYQAENLVTMMTMNAGFNCITPRIVITHAEWKQRAAFLDKIRLLFFRVPLRKAYYPGALETYEKVCKIYPNLEQFGKPQDINELPWALMTGLSSEKENELCFQEEIFCNFYAEVCIHAESVQEFIEKAVHFCNRKLWGNLAATLIADPVTLKTAPTNQAIEWAIAELKYGRIDVNLGSGLGRYLANFPIGPYPSKNLSDVQSGVGFTGNALLLENTEKIILKGPFYRKNNPFLVTQKKREKMAMAMTQYEGKPNFINFCKILVTSLF